jgi:predicted O-methyltransferase YrrM
MNLLQAKRVLKKIPGVSKTRSFVRALEMSRNPFLRFAAPGQLHSPIPDLKYVQEHRDGLFARDRVSCPGIELATDAQIKLVKTLAPHYGEMPFSEERREGVRYYFANPWFGRGSAIMLYSVIRHFRPRRIVEVGSGFSSAAMLDVNDLFFGGDIRFTFIEPFPERLYSLLTHRDRERHRIYTDIVQHAPRAIFSELQDADILFIDSSHVVKVGSDVVLLLTEILPTLRKGVIVHIHDIYWPFEYPEAWILQGTAWNEAYLVKAFLQFNSSFEILLFNSYLALHHQDLMKECLPQFLPDGGSSLWIRRTS